jgi:hypothetical protein
MKKGSNLDLFIELRNVYLYRVTPERYIPLDKIVCFNSRGDLAIDKIEVCPFLLTAELVRREPDNKNTKHIFIRRPVFLQKYIF